ncbi:MAG: ABC transporter substrate-binding protein [Spirochaetales bacterium]|nr:ABC transporter substrate-binding protein [Spirochaetales bacterium]
MGSKKYKLLMFLSVSVITVLVFAACSGVRRDVTVTIGINKWPPCDVWYVSEKLHEPSKEGIKLKLVRYPTWRSNIESFYEGNTDIAHSSYFNLVYYCDKGVKGYLGIAADRVLGADGLVLSSNILDIADLKGKKIGVEVGTDEYFLLYRILKNHSLSLKDVMLVSINSSEGVKYLRSKKVDAVVTYEPYLAEASKYGRLAETTFAYPDILQDVLVFSDRIAMDKRLSANIKKVWYGTINWIFKNRENFLEACAVMAAEEKEDINEYYKFFSQFYFLTEEDNTSLLSAGGSAEKILNEMDSFLYNEGMKNKKCNISALIQR